MSAPATTPQIPLPASTPADTGLLLMPPVTLPDALASCTVVFRYKIRF